VLDLALKIFLTPVLIGLASLAGRRWGPWISGWFVGLPFTSGPVALFLTLEHGTTFGSRATLGIASGTISQAGFCLVYARLAPRAGWPGALLAGSVGFAVVTALLLPLTLPVLAVALILPIVLVLALRLVPAQSLVGVPTAVPPWWDLPARMTVATALVLILTGIAPALGARLAGLLAPFPLYAAVLTCFAHQQRGSPPAIAVLRGLLYGLFAFGAFFLVLSVLLPHISIVLAFGAAIMVGGLVQVGSLVAARPPAPSTFE
jgi:hypothetical protein